MAQYQINVDSVYLVKNMRGVNLVARVSCFK